MADKITEETGIQVFTVSAKENAMVSEGFTYLAKEIK
jgi:hypothetical protein